MNLFDKICAVPTIVLGVVFMALGAFGLIYGSNAHFSLPPILGGLPFFFGWAMCIGLIKYWRLSARLEEATRLAAPPDLLQDFRTPPDIPPPPDYRTPPDIPR